MGRVNTIICVIILICPLLTADPYIIDLGPEEIVQANGQDIAVRGYSVPCYQDWNNDMLGDLIVGEGGGGWPGRVRIYLNIGTESEPVFGDYAYVEAGGAELVCPAQGCLGCFPRVVDWDRDGNKDLLVGLADGTVRFYRNIADNNEPELDSGSEVLVGAEAPVVLDVGARATPCIVDWDQDGLLDLAVGAMDGMVHLYINSNEDGMPLLAQSLQAGLYAWQQTQLLAVPSGRSSPCLVDMDGDGLADLIAGNTNGQILFYRSIGVQGTPVFDEPSPVLSTGQAIDLPGTPRSRPFVCHWTGEGHFGPKDGYWDMLVGSADGKVRLYRGIVTPGDFDADGDLDANDFTFLAKALDKPIPPEGSPADLNADGVVDILDLRAFVDLWLADNG